MVSAGFDTAEVVRSVVDGNFEVDSVDARSLWLCIKAVGKRSPTRATTISRVALILYPVCVYLLLCRFDGAGHYWLTLLKTPRQSCQNSAVQLQR